MPDTAATSTVKASAVTASPERRAEQMAAIERSDDAWSTRRLEQLGVSPGWHCLEVAAGAGSIARWLGAKVAPGGRVVATDTKIDLLESLDFPGLEVRRHDIVRDPLEVEAYDLVHVRHLLANLPGRVPALQRLTAALKPGGWMLIEEIDYFTGRADLASPPGLRSRYDEVLEKILRYMRLNGADPNFGSRVAGLLRLRGFEQVESEAHTRISHGDPGQCTTQEIGFQDLRRPLVDGGKLTEQEFGDFMALYDEPSFAWWDALRVATWARKPLRN